MPAGDGAERQAEDRNDDVEADGEPGELVYEEEEDVFLATFRPKELESKLTGDYWNRKTSLPCAKPLLESVGLGSCAGFGFLSD